MPNSEIGTASAGMKVAEAERRNRKITRMTSADGDQQRFLDVGDGLADRDRAVHHDVAWSTDGGICARNAGSLRQHAIDHRDRVGVGLLLDRQHDRRARR